MRRLSKHMVKVGDTVQCKRAVSALEQYGRSENEQLQFSPGMNGNVFAVDSPAVTYDYRKRKGGTATQVCVRFVDTRGVTNRARLDYTNIKVLKPC